MATGIGQRSCTTLFPLWPLRKNNISKMKNKTKQTNKQKIQRGSVNREKTKYAYPYPDFTLI